MDDSFSGLADLLGVGLGAYSAVNQARRDNTLANAGVSSQLQTTQAQTQTTSQVQSFLPWILGGAAVLVAVVIAVKLAK